MIARISEEVRAWASDRVEEFSVLIVDQPRSDEDDAAVLAWLFAMRPGTTVRDPERDTYRTTCRFLITAVGTNARRCHEIVGQLLTSALQHASFEVEADEPPWSLWQSAGLAPRPAFVLRAEAVAHVERPHVPRVRTPVEVRHTALSAMHGRVLANDDLPIAGAEVEVVGTGSMTRTDRDGRFKLNGVPVDHAPKLRVRAGGHRYAVDMERTALADEPLTIHLQAKES